MSSSRAVNSLLIIVPEKNNLKKKEQVVFVRKYFDNCVFTQDLSLLGVLVKAFSCKVISVDSSTLQHSDYSVQCNVYLHYCKSIGARSHSLVISMITLF